MLKKYEIALFCAMLLGMSGSAMAEWGGWGFGMPFMFPPSYNQTSMNSSFVSTPFGGYAQNSGITSGFNPWTGPYASGFNNVRNISAFPPFMGGGCFVGGMMPPMGGCGGMWRPPMPFPPVATPFMGGGMGMMGGGMGGPGMMGGGIGMMGGGMAGPGMMGGGMGGPGMMGGGMGGPGMMGGGMGGPGMMGGGMGGPGMMGGGMGGPGMMGGGMGGPGMMGGGMGGPGMMGGMGMGGPQF